MGSKRNTRDIYKRCERCDEWMPIDLFNKGKFLCNRYREQRAEALYQARELDRVGEYDEAAIWRDWAWQIPPICLAEAKPDPLPWRGDDRLLIEKPTPPERSLRYAQWKIPEHRAQIGAIYDECKRKNRSAKRSYAVDHIIPISHEEICGLHVPWNLRIITAKQNLKKSNKFKTDWHQNNL